VTADSGAAGAIVDSEVVPLEATLGAGFATLAGGVSAGVLGVAIGWDLGSSPLKNKNPTIPKTIASTPPPVAIKIRGSLNFPPIPSPAPFTLSVVWVVAEVIALGTLVGSVLSIFLPSLTL
jgi:hypothetical protein